MEKYLSVKDTDLAICRIGLGTAKLGLGGDGQAAFGLLETYVKNGGNLIDTARIYSDWVPPETGRSERVLGDWIRHRGGHDGLVFMSKGGHPQMGSMGISRMSRSEMETDLELSLKALGVGCIDIYYYHRDDPQRPVAELVETMESFVKAGKIRYYACSNWTAARMAEADAYCTAMGYRGFIMDQALYNLGSDHMKPLADKTMVKADAALLAYHAGNERNVLVSYMGICGGFFHALAEKGEAAVAGSPYCTPENLKLMERLRSLQAKHGLTLTQVLIGYLLARRPSVIALMGSGDPDHVLDALETLETDLTLEDYDE